MPVAAPSFHPSTTMTRFWLTFGVLTPLLAVFIIQRTSLAVDYWPWFLATHPDSPQASGQHSGGVVYEPDLTEELGQDDQQPLSHHAWDMQGEPQADVFVRRIVAVGDLHGDFGNTRKVLEMSGVIDNEGNWTGNVDFFVQTGDIIDR